jgi:uncharacterized membrane protein
LGNSKIIRPDITINQFSRTTISNHYKAGWRLRSLKHGNLQEDDLSFGKNTPMDNNNPNQDAAITPDDIAKGKTIAILSYCTIIGFVIALVMHQSEKTKYGAYHIRQALGLFIFAIGAAIVIVPITMIIWALLFLIPVLQLTILAFVVLGVINAASGKAKGLPLIGDLSNKMLAGIQ